MLIFGHVGITVGVIKAYEKIVPRKNDIDYRVVMVGSLLPDLIDKPLVQLIYGLTKHSGHYIAHSFIFSGILIGIGLILLLRNKGRNTLTLGICCLIHQLFDKLMLLPNVLRLPVLGDGKFIIPRNLEFIHDITESIYKVVPYLEGVKIYTTAICIYSGNIRWNHFIIFCL
jgi:hypothetical protein